MSPCVKQALAPIAAAFHSRTKRALVVTDGTRTVDEQARLLFLNLEESKNIVRLYAAKTLAREITDAYEKLPVAQRRTKGTATIARTLRAQVARGAYLSKHMREGAVDLRIHDLSSAHRKILRREIRRHKIQLVDESRGKRPHYHLNFMGCLRPIPENKRGREKSASSESFQRPPPRSHRQTPASDR